MGCDHGVTVRIDCNPAISRQHIPVFPPALNHSLRRRDQLAAPGDDIFLTDLQVSADPLDAHHRRMQLIQILQK